MARIPNGEIERLKREVDLVALIQAAGVELKQVGQDLVGLCPFHEETTPSFHVTPKGPDGWPLFHCFGCNVGGDVFRFVELVEHVSFRHAYEIVRAASGGPNGTLAAPDLGHGKHATPLHADTPFASAMTDQALLDAVVAYYHETLKGPSGESAREYLSSRGLVSSEMVDRFRLGYANKTLGYRLPKKTWKEGQEVRARLTALGVIREKTGHEHLAGSLVVPILDEHGHAQGLYGRKVSNSPKLPAFCRVK